MIKFVTIWVLTVMVEYPGNGVGYAYQLQYATQSICEKQRKNHEGSHRVTKCNFQQVPVYEPGEGR